MQNTQVSPLYAVVHINGNRIESKWFEVDEKEQVKEITDQLFQKVFAYNQVQDQLVGKVYTKIPYSYEDGFITYAFGCGLTHYLNGENVRLVTGRNPSSLRVITTSDFSMYGFKQKEKDYAAVLNEMIKQQGVY